MAGRVPRRHREDPDDGGPDLPEDLREARWWYLVAGTPLVALFALASGLAVVPLLVVLDPGPAGAVVLLWLVAVWGLGLVAGVALPVGLYTDGELIGNVWREWTPASGHLAAAGVAVLALYLLTTAGGVVLAADLSGVLYGFVLGTAAGLVVSLFYLVRRRRHLGVP